MYRGNYTSIAEAIQNEKAGTRILVRPGHYRESLVIDKPLEIIGDGNRDDIVLETAGKDLVLFNASMGRMSNLTLRQRGGGLFDAVAIAQGRLDLEDCDISSQGWAAIAINEGADPRVRRNRIQDCKEAGISVYASVSGIIEDNEISGIGSIGIGIHDGADPIVRRNRICDSKEHGIAVFEGGAGLIEDNEIFGNAKSGIDVTDAGNPTVRGNWIRGNQVGIRVYDGGQGTFENNVLAENKRGAWDIAKDCEPNVKRSGNIES